MERFLTGSSRSIFAPCECHEPCRLSLRSPSAPQYCARSQSRCVPRFAEHNRRRLLPAAGAHDHLANPDHSIAHGRRVASGPRCRSLDEQQRRPGAVVADRGHGQCDWDSCRQTGLLDLALPAHDLTTAELAGASSTARRSASTVTSRKAHLRELVAAAAEDRLELVVDLEPPAVDATMPSPMVAASRVMRRRSSTDSRSAAFFAACASASRE